MFACTLKTKPVTLESAGSIGCGSAGCRRGASKRYVLLEPIPLVSAGRAALVHLEAIGEKVITRPVIGCSTQRPQDRRSVERQRLLDLFHECEWMAPLAIELVDEGDDRDVAQPADLEELER